MNERKRKKVMLADEKAVANILKWYGSKEKAMEAVMQSTGDTKEIKQEQDKNTKIYKQFMAAKEANNIDMTYTALSWQGGKRKSFFTSYGQAVLL